jgi:hypothetical protein
VPQTRAQQHVATRPGNGRGGKPGGANFSQRLRHIVLPLLAPAAFAGALLVFLTAVNELTVSALLWSAGKETIGVVIFNLDESGNKVLASAISVLVVALVAGVMLLLEPSRQVFTQRSDSVAELRLERLSKAFGDQFVVRDLDLTIPEGAFTALLGPSGWANHHAAYSGRAGASFFRPFAVGRSAARRRASTCRRRPATWAWSSSLTPCGRMTVAENVGYPLKLRSGEPYGASR